MRYRAAQPPRRPSRRLGKVLLLLLLTPRLLLLLPLLLLYRPPPRGASPGPKATTKDFRLQDRLAQPVRALLRKMTAPLRSSPRHNDRTWELTKKELRVRVTLLPPPRFLTRASRTLRRRLRRMRR